MSAQLMQNLRRAKVAKTQFPAEENYEEELNFALDEDVLDS